MDVLERAAEVESKMSGSEDVIRLDFKIAGKSAVIFYIDAMIDKMAFEIGVMKPLKGIEEISMPYEKSFNRVVTSSMPIYVEEFEKAIEKLASSDMLMLVEGSDDSYIISLRSFAMRVPNEPPRETVLKGPREGFVEDIKTNMTLIRRRLKTPDLAFENMTAGKYTKTPISICYIKGIAEEKVIEEVKSRIKEINTDGILDSSYVARYIEERKYSIFNEVGSVEKPDVLTGKLLEGRVGVLVDGSPIVLTVPLVFLEQFQSAEDYYVKSFRATFTRLVRIFAFFLAILLPAGYVALQEFQYQIFPLIRSTVAADARDDIRFAHFRNTQRSGDTNAETYRNVSFRGRSDSSRRSRGKRGTPFDAHDTRRRALVYRNVHRSRRSGFFEYSQNVVRDSFGSSRTLRSRHIVRCACSVSCQH